MRVSILAVGRLRPGPQKALIDEYLMRFDRTGRALGLGPSQVIEVEDKKGGGKTAEGVLLLKSIPHRSVVIALDERGTVMPSPKFADVIARHRDDGASDLVCVIGGADGLSADVLSRATMKLSFGQMVWPHMLARAMLSEQLYRAASILSGSPYHRV
ncbi:MAG: 23S rRNA (pseudouridine(1915)-N(3))-methyltransferase RlmH [Pseudomonadota bacterium]